MDEINKCYQMLYLPFNQIWYDDIYHLQDILLQLHPQK